MISKKTFNLVETVFEKEIKTSPDNVPEIIHRKAVEFEIKWGKEPKAFLIGPHEYMCLFKVLKESVFGYAHRQTLIEEPEEFMGMQIRLKQSPGIEMEFPKEMWGIIAMGKLK